MDFPMIFIDFRLPQTAQSRPKSMKIIGKWPKIHDFSLFHEKKRYTKWGNLFPSQFDKKMVCDQFFIRKKWCGYIDASYLTPPAAASSAREARGPAAPAVRREVHRDEAPGVRAGVVWWARSARSRGSGHEIGWIICSSGSPFIQHLVTELRGAWGCSDRSESSADRSAVKFWL